MQVNYNKWPVLWQAIVKRITTRNNKLAIGFEVIKSMFLNPEFAEFLFPFLYPRVDILILIASHNAKLTCTRNQPALDC
jgi:hypothetical protein